MRTHEVVLAETQEDVGLAHPRVPDDQQLGQVVVTVLPHQNITHPQKEDLWW
jgi:hypothetical protein